MKIYDLSLREMSIILNEYIVLCDPAIGSLYKETEQAKVIVLFFVMLKYKFPTQYKGIFDGKEIGQMVEIYGKCGELIKEYLVVDLSYINTPLSATKEKSGFSFCEKEMVYYLEQFFANYKNDVKNLRNSLEYNTRSGDPESDRRYYYMYSKLTVRDYVAFKINGFWR